MMQPAMHLPERREPADVWAALSEVRDPCLLAAGHDLSIVDLGLVARVTEAGGALEIGITFTEVGCQFTHRVIAAIEERIERLGRHSSVRVVPEWRPAWTEERMNGRARAALGEGRLRLARLFAAARGSAEGTGAAAVRSSDRGE